MLKEFREFAISGNMVDLAIAVVLGTAFGAVVSSLVSDVIMPPLGLALGAVDFTNMFIVLKEAPGTPGPYPSLDAAQKAGAVVLSYGAFVNTIVRFLLVAIAMFFVVRAMNRMRKAEQPAAEPAPSAEVLLLTEIRDLLRAR
jgi:large conductance mechanosensitive channel